MSALVLASISLSVLKVLSSAGSSLILLLAQVIFDTFLGIEANGSEVRSCSSTLYSISLSPDLLTAHPIVQKAYSARAATGAAAGARRYSSTETSVAEKASIPQTSSFQSWNMLEIRALGPAFLVLLPVMNPAVPFTVGLMVTFIRSC